MTHQINRFGQNFGGQAIRFTRKDGDLSAIEGVNKLMTWVRWYEPTHVWAAPDCKAWGGLNIQRHRNAERVHLQMCAERLKRPSEPRDDALGSLQLKRRRWDYKQPCPEAFQPPPEEWETILRDVSKGAPRVGIGK